MIALRDPAAPQADHDAPFEWLRACHDRVERMVDLLQRLHVYLEQRAAVDRQAQEAVQQVLRYFDLAAPLHHEDEERHVFPRLLASADAALVAAVTRLQADHGAMAADWPAVRAWLQRVMDAPLGASWTTSADEAALLQRFAGRYEAHIALEEQTVFPAAQACMDEAALRAMGDDMMRRRAIGGAASPQARPSDAASASTRART